MQVWPSHHESCGRGLVIMSHAGVCDLAIMSHACVA